MTDDVHYNYTEGKLKETKTEDENGGFKRTDVIIYKEENKPTPYVNLRNITSLKFCDDAIGKCWDKQSNELNTARMDRVINKHNHESTVEHIVAQFEISNVSRLLLQELARHRMASITVKSTRYTLKELKDEEPFDCSTMINFMESMIRAKKYLVYPQDLITYIPDEKDQLVNKAQIMALEQLRSLVAAGISNDKIKYVLPESYKTELSWTINFRSLRNFLKLRTDKAAHFEIRALAYDIYNVIPPEYRFLLEDMLYGEPVDTEA